MRTLLARASASIEAATGSPKARVMISLPGRYHGSVHRDVHRDDASDRPVRSGHHSQILPSGLQKLPSGKISSHLVRRMSKLGLIPVVSAITSPARIGITSNESDRQRERTMTETRFQRPTPAYSTEPRVDVKGLLQKHASCWSRTLPIDRISAR